MDPQVEARLSPLLAQAAQRLLQQNMAEAAQQQAQQQMQDPLVQLQMKEVAIKEADLQRKKEKDAADIDLDKKRLDIEAAKALAQSENTKRQLSVTTGVDMLKTLSANQQKERLEEKKLQSQERQAAQRAQQAAQQAANKPKGKD